jgi:hypothetical protein
MGEYLDGYDLAFEKGRKQGAVEAYEDVINKFANELSYHAVIFEHIEKRLKELKGRCKE